MNEQPQIGPPSFLVLGGERKSKGAFVGVSLPLKQPSFRLLFSPLITWCSADALEQMKTKGWKKVNTEEIEKRKLIASSC